MPEVLLQYYVQTRWTNMTFMRPKPPTKISCRNSLNVTTNKAARKDCFGQAGRAAGTAAKPVGEEIRCAHTSAATPCRANGIRNFAALDGLGVVYNYGRESFVLKTIRMKLQRGGISWLRSTWTYARYVRAGLTEPHISRDD